jgi:hypothetical protein
VWVHDPALSDVPAIGDYPNAVVGDILLNINPDLTLSPDGEPMYPDLWFASWICVAIPNPPYKAFKGMEAIF